MIIYRLLDCLFMIFHTTLIFFNMFGWIWKKTRIWNLVTILLTAASWLFLGMVTGSPGYCPLTDWHFRVLEKLGKTDLPLSYIKYLADRITGLDFNASLIDKVTLWALIAALTVSLVLNLIKWTGRKRNN